MAKENFKMFKDMWEEGIRKIENEVIDNRGAVHIYNHFAMCRNHLHLVTPDYSSQDLNLEIELLRSRLGIALEIAHTKFMLQNRSLWVRIIESIVRVVQKVPKS